MTKDRQNLLVAVFGLMYRHRCPCGRCDCASSDPIALARRVFIHWSCEFRHLASAATTRGELYRSFERKAVRSKNALIRARRDEHASKAIHEERAARRWGRAALRYERLGRGLPPFVAAEAEGSRA